MLYKLFIIVIFLFSACNSKNKDRQVVKSTVTNTVENYDSPIEWLDSYTLLYNKNILSDTNLILMGKSGANDTTEIIQIYNNRKYVRLINYSQTPAKFQEGRTNNPRKKQFHSYIGTSFEITREFWDSINTQITKLNLSNEISDNFPSCCDVTTYRLSFKGKIYLNSNENNQIKLENFFRNIISTVKK